jgi:hypothetical protein
MILKRRGLLQCVSVLTLGLLPAERSLSQVIYKFPWHDLIAPALEFTLWVINRIFDRMGEDSQEAKAAFCRLSPDAITELKIRCFSVAQALDSTGEGPVVPPEKGTIGIIPALAQFSTEQDQAAIREVRDAAVRFLVASKDLISELYRGNWLTLLPSADTRTYDLNILSFNLEHASHWIGDLMGSYIDVSVTPDDVKTARRLSEQLAGMPANARRAIDTIQQLETKRLGGYCTRRP